MRGVCKRSIHENLDLLAEPKKTLQQAMEELKAEDARLFRMRQIQIRTCLCCVGLLMTAVLIQIASLNPGNPPKVSASTAPVEEKMRPSSKVVIDLEEDHSNTSLTGRNITLSNSSPP